jgi:hypothetical protein
MPISVTQGYLEAGTAGNGETGNGVCPVLLRDKGGDKDSGVVPTE